MSYILKELPAITPQKRPTIIPTDFVRSSIREWNFLACDTETRKNGKVFMMALESATKTTNGFKIQPTVHYVDSFNDIVNVFLSKGRIVHGKKRRFCHPSYSYYNLRFDIQAFLGHLPNPIIELIRLMGELSINYETEEIVDFKCEETDHSRTVKIFYIPKKTLKLEFHPDHTYQPPKKGKRTPTPISGGKIDMWDIAQFFGTSLMEAGKRHLGQGKTERCRDGSILDVRKLDTEVMIKVKCAQGVIYEKHRYEEYYKEDIEWYCAVDAHLTGRLSRMKLMEFVNTDVSFRDPYSIAAIAQRDLLNKGYKEVVMADDEIMTYLKVGLTAFKGGHFEATEVGLIEDVVTYDLKSAYPANQWNIPAMTKWVADTYVHNKTGEVRQHIKYGQPKMKAELRGQFHAGTDVDEMVALCEPRIDLSPAYCLVYMAFPEGNKWNPLCYVGKKPPLTTPRIFRGWITYDEYKEALNWNPVTSIVERYLVWTDEENSVKEYPFRPFIQHWFNVKESTDSSDPAYLISKVLLNSIYGKTIACVEGKTGALWNPFFASMTTGYTRMELARFNRINGKKAVMVATDGIIIRKKDFIEMPERLLECPKNLGRWELEAENVDALIMMSGVYAIRERTASKKKSYIGFKEGNYAMLEDDIKSEKSKFRGTASYFLNGEDMGWFKFCERYADEDCVQMNITRPYSMGEARFNLDLMNVFIERDISIRACGDSSKRMYRMDDKPTTFGDLLTRSYQLDSYDSYAHVNRVINGLVEEVEDDTWN